MENQNQDQVQQPIVLNLQDLRVLAGAVEIGAARGAYRANEMELIGAMYNKLALFLKSNTPAEGNPAPAETSAAAEVTKAPQTDA